MTNLNQWQQAFTWFVFCFSCLFPGTLVGCLRHHRSRHTQFMFTSVKTTYTKRSRLFLTPPWTAFVPRTRSGTYPLSPPTQFLLPPDHRPLRSVTSHVLSFQIFPIRGTDSVVEVDESFLMLFARGC